MMTVAEVIRSIPDVNTRMALLAVFWVAEQTPPKTLTDLTEKFGTYGREQFDQLMGTYGGVHND